MQKIGQLKHKSSTQISDSNWAVHYCEHIELGMKYSIEKLSQSGVKWVRYYYDSLWSKIEVKKGEYNFENLDAHIDEFLKHKITPFLQIGGGNFLYTEGLVGYHPMVNNEVLKAFLKYADKMVSRYKDKIFYWEIWNEVNMPNFWKPKPDINQYQQLLCEVSKIIRKHQGNKAKIIAASFAGVPTKELEQLMQLNTKGQFDILGVHPYHYHPESAISGISAVQEIAAKYDENIIVWNTECGIESSGATIHGRQLTPWGYNIQAKWVLRKCMVDALLGLKMSTYFMLSDIRYTKKQYDNKEIQVRDDKPISHYVGTNTKGLISYDDGSEKPSYKALQNLTFIVDIEYKKFDAQVTFDITDEGIFYGAGKSEREFLNPYYLTYKSDKKGNMLIYWLPWVMQEIINPATVNIDVSKMGFIDPVLIDLLSGEVYNIKHEKQNKIFCFKDIILTDYPIAIAERKNVI